MDRRGDLFLDWAFATFGDGERRGSGELPEDSSSSAGRSISSGAGTSLPPTEFASAHFLPATGSPVHAIRPSAWPAPLVLLPSLDARGGTGLQGLSSLDW